MASTWSALKVELLETGQNSGQWGNLTNANLGDAVLGEAITGSATVDFPSDADVTITLTDFATTQAARNLRLNITESSTGVGSVRNLILGSNCQIEKFYLINNTGTGAKTVKNTSGTGITVPAGKATLVYNDGTNVVDAASYFTSLTLGSALPVASGGTGLTAGTSGGIPAYTASGTLTSSGVLAQYGVVIGGGAGAVPTSTAVGASTHVLTSNGSGVAPTFQAPASSGTVTAVSVASTNGFAGTSSGGATPALTLSTSITGVLKGNATAISAAVAGTDYVTPAGSETLTNKTINASNNTVTNVSLTSGVTGTLPVANGGTGLATLTANNVLLGNGASAPLFVAPGSSGNVLTSNGSTWASTAPAGGSSVKISSRTSNTVLGTADNSYLIDITSGTFTQTFTAAATLGSGWFCYVRNSGTGDITLDPNASEQIDGKTSYVMYPQECRLIQCSGTAFTSVVIHPFIRTITSTATLVVPPGYSRFAGTLWGGGGSGGKSSNCCRNTGGGGGGAAMPFQMTSAELIAAGFIVTVGAGGVAQTGATNGNAGGATTIGGYGYAYGGGAGGGSTGNSKLGGGGGGAFGPGSTGGNFSDLYAYGGSPAIDASGTSSLRNISGGAFGGAWSSTAVNLGSGHGHYGGGGGGSSGVGGNSVYGGAGGGHGCSGSGGSSFFGGNGGAGGGAGSGTAGSAPGGGGGGTLTGASSGAGGNGQVVIFGVA